MENTQWTVAVTDMSDRQIDVEQAASQSGYIPFFAQETSQQASHALFLNAGASASGLERIHCDTRLVVEQGIRVFRGGFVAGHSFPFINDKLVTDGSMPSRISEAFAIQEGLVDGAFQQKDIVDVDESLLIIAGPGYPIWGHWLLDFLPRLFLAQAVLGHDLKGCVIPLPNDTPYWVFALVKFFCGLEERRFYFYDRDLHAVRTAGMCYLPTFAHTDYFMHSCLHDFYKRYIPTVKRELPAKICISRQRFRDSRSVARNFPGRGMFERTAQKHGYEIIFPEQHSFRAQIDLFANAHRVVGEFGSGMHNTMFAPSGTRVGQFVYPNDIQSRIAGLCGHESIFLMPDNQPRFDQPVPAEMEISQIPIDAFFEAMEQGNDPA